MQSTAENVGIVKFYKEENTLEYHTSFIASEVADIAWVALEMNTAGRVRSHFERLVGVPTVCSQNPTAMSVKRVLSEREADLTTSSQNVRRLEASSANEDCLSNHPENFDENTS